MTPEEIGTPSEPAAAAPAPVEAAPPPVESSAPPPEPDTRSEPPSEMWRAIVDQVGVAPPIVESAREARDAAARPTRQTLSAPAEPAAPAPRRWAGRFATPEELESAHQEVSAARDRAESERQRTLEHAERLERLLAESLRAEQLRQPPPQPPAGVDPDQWRRAQAAEQTRAQQPPVLQAALKMIQAEAERLALGDPQADPLRLVRAVAVASRLDDESRRYFGDLAISEYNQQHEVESALQGIQNQFFETYPDLRSARPSLLRQVAIETEDALRQSRRDYGSPQYMQAWFEETAKQARASIRVGDGTASVPAPSAAARPPSGPSPARSARGAPFAETPAPRPQEPVLSGQDVHLARVFGRGA